MEIKHNPHRNTQEIDTNGCQAATGLGSKTASFWEGADEEAECLKTVRAARTATLRRYGSELGDGVLLDCCPSLVTSGLENRVAASRITRKGWIGV